MPTFSLAYTSVRANAIPVVVKLWNSRARNPSDIEWVIAVDDGDEKCIIAATTLSAVVDNVKVAVNSGPKNCTAGWNAAASQTTGKVIIAVPDDFVPPQDWDHQPLSLEPQGWPDGEFVVHINDGYVKTLCTLAIVTRKRYERFGYLFYPLYESMFNDTELTEVAYRDGVVIDAMHLLFEHFHPDCKKRERDSVDLHHASKARWDSGEELFNRRKAEGFPNDFAPAPDVGRPPPVDASDEWVAYLQVTKDDFCLLEVCSRLLDEGLTTFFFCVPDEYWSGDKTPDEEIDSVKHVVRRLGALGAESEIIKINVAKHRLEGRSRIDVETRVRNESLSLIRARGFSNIVIVDGDELWLPGTLGILRDYVDRVSPAAVACGMIPAIGLPSYPVAGSTDKATIYISGKHIFKECRGPAPPTNILHIRGIIHFTGTRRNMAEIYAKHRRSGHYDDPNYSFEHWLQFVLPNIKPGFQNAHMFTGYQIWPEVRAWTKAELDAIPASLHRYLGTETGKAKTTVRVDTNEQVAPIIEIQHAGGE